MGKHVSYLHTFAVRTVAYLRDIFSESPVSGASRGAERSRFGRIAVIISHEKNMWALSVVQRFFSSLREQMGYQQTPDIEVLAAQGSREHLIRIMSGIRQEQGSGRAYEAIVTVGNWCSKEVRDVLDAWQCEIPQVFCPVSDPVALGLVDSLERTGGHITGVTAVLPGFDRQVEMLKALVPEAQTVVALYDPFLSDATMAQIIEQHRQDLESACKTHDISLRTHHLKSSEVSPQWCREAIGSGDIVCTLPEPTVYAHIESLVEACNEKRVPLCTAELSSLYQGAAVGFGEHGATYGGYAAAIIYDMLVNHRPLSSIPVIKLSQEPQMRFNQQALEAQGLFLSPRAKCLLSMTSIFKD